MSGQKNGQPMGNTTSIYMSADRENTYFPPEILEGKKKPYIIGPILKNLLVLVKDGERNIDVVYRECMLFIMYKSEY